jgi:negative regulator of replication initiation
MVILKTHTKREPYKYIGVFLPQWVHEYFALYTLAKGESKSTVIRRLFEEWITNQHTTSADSNDAKLISEIIQTIKLQWKLERVTHPNIMLSVYKANVKAELTSRGINSQYIETILKELE